MPAARLAVFLFATLALRVAAQQPPAQPATARPSPAEVRLENHDNRTQFTLDEPITVDLVFTAQSSGYFVNVSGYGDMSEKLHVTPAEGWLLTHTASAHDYAQHAALTPGKLIRIPVLLNQGLTFQRPGHYEVSITTSRLVPPRPEAGSDLTTNSVALEITAPDEEKEAEQVRLLSNQISSLRGRPRTEAAQKLAFLSGEAAVREKIRWLLGPEDGAGGNVPSAILDGLGSSRDLQLQLNLLKAAWGDPQRIPNPDMEQALAETRRFLRREPVAGWQMAVVSSSSDAETLARQERLRDLQLIVDSLPQRTGANRTQTAYFLMEFAELSGPQVKSLVLQEFPHMSSIEQNMLLETRWKDLKDRALVPTLKDMLAIRPGNRDALQRLVELEPDTARPFVIRAICDPKSDILLEQVAEMPDKNMPEVTPCLLDQLQKRLPILSSGPYGSTDQQFQSKAELAARFATSDILPPMRELYRAAKATESPGIISPRPALAVLTYLLRQSPAEAVAIIKGFGGPSQDLYEIGRIYTLDHEKFPEELNDLFRRDLMQGTPAEAKWAAYQLSTFGSPEDKSLLLQRLEKLHAEWAPRSAELANVEPSDGTDPLAAVAMLESELILPLIRTGEVWTVTPEEKAALAKTCLTPACKAFFH